MLEHAEEVGELSIPRTPSSFIYSVVHDRIEILRDWSQRGDRATRGWPGASVEEPLVRKTRVSLNLPRSLEAAAEDRARRDAVPLDHFIACALAEKVGAKNAATFLEKRGQGGDPERAVRWLEARPE